VLRRIFGSKKDEVTKQWRMLRKNELYAFYSLPDIIQVIKSRRQTDRTCSTNGGSRNVYRRLMGKLEAKRPLRRSRRKWVDNIKMDLREVGRRARTRSI
jgi:hypothetical protein